MTTILTGDALKKLRTLPAASVQMCVTSPPYWGLREYQTPPQIWGGDPNHSHEWGAATRTPWANHVPGPNGGRKNGTHSRQQVKYTGPFCECGAWRGSLGLEPTIELYVAHIVEAFREVRRVLRDDGTLWLNLGDSYATGAGKAGIPGGGKQGENWQGPKGYRGAHDPSTKHRGLTQVPDSKNPNAGIPTFQPNRMPQAGLKPKDLCMIPARVALALQADGWYLRSDIIWAKGNPMPESVTDRPTKSHEYLFLLSKSAKYFYDHEAIKEAAIGRTPHDLTGCGALAPGQTLQRGNRYNSGNRQRKLGDGTESRLTNHLGRSVPWEGDTRNKRTVWYVNTRPLKAAHFATFPPKLIEPCILAGSRKGDAVLDPFFGAGTVGVVTEQHQRDCIGIELNPSYVKMARERIAPPPLKRKAAA